MCLDWGGSLAGGVQASKAKGSGSNVEGQLVALDGPGARQRSGRQLDHQGGRGIDARGPPWAEIVQGPDHSARAVDEGRVDGKTHEKRMDGRAGLDDQGGALGQAVPAEQAAE